MAAADLSQSVNTILDNDEDKAKCAKEMIWTLLDVKLIQNEDDWTRLALSDGGKKKLLASVGGAGSLTLADLKSVDSLITDKEQLAILHAECIWMDKDVELLRQEDWDLLMSKGLNEQSRLALNAFAGSSGVYAVEHSELAEYLKGPKFTTDLLILGNEMIYTLEDVYRLTGEDWAELADKRLLPEARRRLEAALPPRPKPLVGRPTLNTPVGSVVHEVYFYRCRQKLTDQMIQKMGDVMNLTADLLTEKGVSQPAVQKLMEAKKMIEEDSVVPEPEPQENYLDEAWDNYNPFRGVDPQAASKRAILKKRIAVLDRAIRCAHRLAVQAEMEAIRRADEVAKLKFKQRQMGGQ